MVDWAQSTYQLTFWLLLLELLLCCSLPFGPYFVKRCFITHYCWVFWKCSVLILGNFALPFTVFTGIFLYEMLFYHSPAFGPYFGKCCCAVRCLLRGPYFAKCCSIISGLFSIYCLLVLTLGNAALSSIASG